MTKKKLFIKTYGCQMNVYDSGRMADILRPIGYGMAENAEEADLVILNTCHIREKAEEKVFSDLGRLKAIKDQRGDQGKDTIMAVAGCVAQAEGAEIVRRAPYVDIVLGPQTYHRLPEMVARATRAAGEKKGKRKAVLDTDFPAESKFDFLPEESADIGPTAFLSVQEGCDKFCTFCVVPYTRGAEFSRPVTQILDEAKRLVAGGAREITLLGQNVNAYHGMGIDGNREWGLGDLLRELAGIEGLDRLRYTTSHPRDMNDDLIKAHGEIEILMPYLHLPIQAGSDRILDAMNRKHTGEQYRRLIDKIRDARPDIALSSDFIVGFPGETDQDFEATLQMVRDVGYAQAFSFKYSPRPGTPAALQEQQIEEAVKDERLQRLQNLLQQYQRQFNESKIDQVLPVLFDKKGKDEMQMAGRSPYLQIVHVTAPHRLYGQILPVRITKAGANSLQGEVMTEMVTSHQVTSATSLGA